ncbi:hypothetical protein [Desulfobotulus mexicanus]|uniref:Polysaccharide chain length determinant N-terminal domain-containing protein n=1 Tax=Desulfobotulus mexicanus TaxID=2586642 RepID=A0A5Q4VEQ3_9BACT|nr:hypothetical protein [Desulfobotulus mexicanus]TYT76154.1 hypothetical protein FIM25_00950 [Desulfobotulus mexicanus]
MNKHSIKIQDGYFGALEEDEISLVDIAKVLVKRWPWFAIVFMAVLATGFSLIFLYNNNSHEYLSIYRVAESSPGNPLISLKSTGEKAEVYYKGLVVNDFLAQKNVKALSFPFDIEVADNSGMIIAKSRSSVKDNVKIESIRTIHKMFFSMIVKEEGLVHGKKVEILSRKIESAEKALELLSESANLNVVEFSIQYMDQIAQAKNDLATLNSGEILQLAQVQPEESKKALMIAVVGMLAFMSGIMAPFLAEFGARVRHALREK